MEIFSCTDFDSDWLKQNAAAFVWLFEHFFFQEVWGGGDTQTPHCNTWKQITLVTQAAFE